MSHLRIQQWCFGRGETCVTCGGSRAQKKRDENGGKRSFEIEDREDREGESHSGVNWSTAFHFTNALTFTMRIIVRVGTRFALDIRARYFSTNI